MSPAMYLRGSHAVYRTTEQEAQRVYHIYERNDNDTSTVRIVLLFRDFSWLVRNGNCQVDVGGGES